MATDAKWKPERKESYVERELGLDKRGLGVFDYFLFSLMLFVP